MNPQGPILYLFRSFVPDTAGPGRTRGGATTGLALLPYDVEGLNAMVIGHGVEVPNSVGLHGGMPGACATHMLRRSNQDIASLLGRYYDAATIMADSQTQDLGAKPGGFRIGPGDVFAYTFRAAAAMAIQSAVIRSVSPATFGSGTFRPAPRPNSTASFCRPA